MVVPSLGDVTCYKWRSRGSVNGILKYPVNVTRQLTEPCLSVLFTFYKRSNFGMVFKICHHDEKFNFPVPLFLQSRSSYFFIESSVTLALFLNFARPPLIEPGGERDWVEVGSDVIQSTQTKINMPNFSKKCDFWTACELRICFSWRKEFEIFNIQSEQQQQGDDNLRLANLHSCPPSVRTACELRICFLWKWLI